MTTFTQQVLLSVVILSVFCVKMFGAGQLPQLQMLPHKVAERAYFELIGTEQTRLTNFVFLAIDATIETAVSNENNQKIEVYKISFPVNHYSWTEFSIRFTPLTDGEITLKLAGPFELSKDGKPYREINLWDNIQITGSEIKNPGFEDVVGNLPKEWVTEGGVANSGPMRPREGKNYGRTSFDRTLKTQLKIKANNPVTIKLFARSQPPPSFNDMRRITASSTTAHAGIGGFSRGVNLPKYLDLPPENKALCPYIFTDFDLIKSEGFDHVRIPITWHHVVAPPDFKIPSDFFLKVEYMITNSFVKGLNVILAWTDFDNLNENPAANMNMFYAVWQQISDFYNLYPTNLAYELFDCPSEKMPSNIMNAIYNRTLEIIRQRNPERLVFLGAQGYSIDNLGKLRLSFEDDAIVVCVRIDEPLVFTQQGLQRKGLDLRNLKGIVFPGPPVKKIDTGVEDKTIAEWLQKYNNLPAELNPSSNRINLMKLDTARQWSEFYGRPVYLCGFGASYYADNISRTTYYSQIRQVAEEYGIKWLINDWKFEYRYIDPARNQPTGNLRDALFKK